MKHLRIYRLFPVALVALSLSMGGCTKGNESVPPLPPEGIVFSAATQGTPPSKTSYTGQGTLTEGKLTRERIDWVDGDRLTVLSPQAQVLVQSGTTFTPGFNLTATVQGSTVNASVADYTVSSHQTPVGLEAVSRALISPVDGTGLLWGTGEHTFYAVYPSASSAVFSAAEKARLGFREAPLPILHGTIPTAQTPQWFQGGRPLMHYAWMSAVATAAPAAASVDMSFTPQFTAFEFTLSSGDFPVVDLASFSFAAETAGAAVTGDFTLDMATGTVSTSNTSNQITVDMSGRRVSAATTSAPAKDLTFTVLGLPVNMTAMRMTFTGTQIGTRTLTLKNKNGSEITFAARKKYRIGGIRFPMDFVPGGQEIIWDQTAFGEEIFWEEDSDLF